MSLEKQQQKNTKQKKHTSKLKLCGQWGCSWSIYIFKFNLNTITYKPMIAIYKYKSVWILNNLKWTFSPKSINNSI